MKKQIVLLLCIACSFHYLHAQADPEFRKDQWVLYLEGHQGLATNFTHAPDIYVGNIRMCPQITVVPSKLRIGVIAGGLLINKNIDGLIGASLTYKLSTLHLRTFGSLLNIQLQAEQLWATHHQQLAGLAIKTEIGQIAIFSISGHRDYYGNAWWWQTGVGYNIWGRRKAKVTDPLQ
jgi:hypothetical protein